MAPRGRAKKVGTTRMDAAIDALKPMGYSSDFVRHKVKQLLKVYGDEGWSFIEEASYTLLINYILEDEGEQGEPSTKNEDTNQVAKTSQVELSTDVIDPLCSTQDPLPNPVTVLNPLLALGEPTLSPSKNNDTGELAIPENSFYDFCLPQGQRKPCFGWIGQKDEEDIVLLKPAPVQGWRSWKTGEKRRKRKSRWDVGPDDLVC